MRTEWIWVAAIAMSCVVRADYVQLKNGTRIEGRILAENADGLEIEVGANETGTIRRVLIIHSSEISTWAADEQKRVVESDRRTVNRLAGSDYVKRLLAEAEQKIDDRQYDRGIDEFQQAAEIATQNLDELEGEEKLEALNLRAHALRLALAALEGKVELIENETDGVQDELDERKDKWVEDWDQLQDDKRDYERRGGTRRVELGSRRSTNDFVEREEALKIEKAKIDHAIRTVGVLVEELERRKVEAEAKIKLIEERVDQAEDEAKIAEREARRRN